MKILGIDPGIGRVGWGVIDKKNVHTISPIVYDCFETKADLAVPTRLFHIHTFINHLITTYQPESVAIEELFFNTNAKTAFVVGQARGVILLAAAEKNIPVAIYTPLQVKIAVVGYGRAEKQQVGKMVQVQLKLSSIPKPDDTADALAIALTHAYSNK